MRARAPGHDIAAGARWGAAWSVAERPPGEQREGLAQVAPEPRRIAPPGGSQALLLGLPHGEPAQFVLRPGEGMAMRCGIGRRGGLDVGEVGTEEGDAPLEDRSPCREFAREGGVAADATVCEQGVEHEAPRACSVGLRVGSLTYAGPRWSDLRGSQRPTHSRVLPAAVPDQRTSWRTGP